MTWNGNLAPLPRLERPDALARGPPTTYLHLTGNPETGGAWTLRPFLKSRKEWQEQVFLLGECFF